jgi:RNA polymerase sigma-70 factor (ECF subfamily)
MTTPSEQISKILSVTDRMTGRYEDASEICLLSAARAGDQHAFAELYMRNCLSVRQTIFRIVRNHEDTSDILQETFLKAFQHLNGFQEHAQFRTWITRIAINTSLMLLRKQRTLSETDFAVRVETGDRSQSWDVPDRQPTPEHLYERIEMSRRLRQAVGKLPPGLRKIVELYHRDDGTLVDAANVLGITEAAAKSRLLRARQRLCLSFSRLSMRASRRRLDLSPD